MRKKVQMVGAVIAAIGVLLCLVIYNAGGAKDWTDVLALLGGTAILGCGCGLMLATAPRRWGGAWPDSNKQEKVFDSAMQEEIL